MAFKLLPDQEKSPSLNAESVHRLPSQALKGAGAVLPGIFGDVASLGYSGLSKIGESAFGQKSVPYEQSPLGKILPTTEQHKKNLEEGIPYLKPKNKIEKFVDDVSSDAMSLFIPGAALARAGLRGTSALKSLATSLGANAGGEFVTQFSGDEKKGAYTKMGMMLLGSVLNKPTVQKEINSLYQQADRLLPQNATVNATRLEGELNALRNRVLQGRQIGDLAPSEKFVVEQADTILRQIQNGQANVGTLRASLRSLNENLQRAVYEAPDKGSRVRARSLATQINRDINRTLADYGRTNPKWWKAHKSSNEAFGTMQQSNFVTNFIRSHVHGNTFTAGLLHALGVTGGAIGGIVPYQAAKIIYRISKSPTLAKHYARIAGSASAENAPLMNKEIKKLDQELQKDEKKRSKKFRLLE